MSIESINFKEDEMRDKDTCNICLEKFEETMRQLDEGHVEEKVEVEEGEGEEEEEELSRFHSFFGSESSSKSRTSSSGSDSGVDRNSPKSPEDRH